jgi:uncharacterized protein YjbJ (UPF0337 family)
MNNEHVKGGAQKVEGAIKETAGKVVGNPTLEAEGKADKAAGAAHQAAGDVKDAAGKIKDAVNR